MDKYLNTTNVLLVLGALSAIAHVVQAVVPRGTVAYVVADKLLALGPNLYQLMGQHPNPPAAYPGAPNAPIVLPPPSQKGQTKLELLAGSVVCFSLAALVGMLVFWK